jgi:hypothetical protein
MLPLNHEAEIDSLADASAIVSLVSVPKRCRLLSSLAGAAIASLGPSVNLLGAHIPREEEMMRPPRWGSGWITATATARLARTGIVVGGPLLVMLACASTTTREVSEFEGELVRPDRILVYEPAVSTGDVELDEGLLARIGDGDSSESEVEARREAGRAVANVYAERLVEELRRLGIPTERATGAPPYGDIALLVRGVFLSIDEGNQTKRVVIGLGAGQSRVELLVRAFHTSPLGEQLVKEFEVEATSSYKPGMAATMGVGAAAGNLAVSAAVSTAGTAASEKLSDDVDADAKRSANEARAQFAEFFVEQGWITAEVAEGTAGFSDKVEKALDEAN